MAWVNLAVSLGWIGLIIWTALIPKTSSIHKGSAITAQSAMAGMWIVNFIIGLVS